MQGKHTGHLAAEATAKKKKHTPHPHGSRISVGAAGVGTNVPLPMPHVGLPGTATALLVPDLGAPLIGPGK